MGITVSVNDNSKLAKEELETAIKKALMQCGEIAINYASKACPVDTGLLRNSLAYARGGESSNPSSYADNEGKNHGTYDGKAPSDSDSKYVLHVGTNVEYAKMVECGLGQDEQPYLAPALKDHGETYKSIILKELKS